MPNKNKALGKVVKVAVRGGKIVLDYELNDRGLAFVDECREKNLHLSMTLNAIRKTYGLAKPSQK